MKRIHTNNYIRVLSVLTAVLLLLTCLAPTILAAGTESLKLWAWDRKDTLSFDFQNMLPGDSEYKTYEITVSYKKATNLIYSIKIDEGGEKLAEVLRVEVSVDDKIVYDGLMKDMTPVIHNLSGNAPWKVLFKVRVYLDTSVGNEYMGKTLSADFKWEISSGGSSGSDETTSSKKPNWPVIWPTSATKPTTATTTVATTTETTTTETTTEATTTETTTTETTTVETTTEETTTEATTTETTTEPPRPPIPPKPCCECKHVYFPWSCNFRFIPGNRCELPWCCREDLGLRCWCPWCWIIPVLILIILDLILILAIAHKILDDDKNKVEEDDEYDYLKDLMHPEDTENPDETDTTDPENEGGAAE